LLISGHNYHKFSSALWMTQSPSGSRQMAITRLNQHTMCSSRGWSGTGCGIRFGRLRWRTNAVFSHGCYFRTSCQHRIVSLSMADKQTLFALYVAHMLKHIFTWLPSVPTQRCCGSRSLLFSTSRYHHWLQDQWDAGDARCCGKAPMKGKATCRWSSTPSGMYGRRDAAGCSRT
jgi:hypothetical protein